MTVVPYTILQFLDSSVHSAAAVDLIAVLPLPAGSKVRLLAVGSQAPQPERTLMPAAQDRARAVLEHHGLWVTSQVLAGGAAKWWQSVAEEQQPDLVVIGANDLRSKAGGPWRDTAHQVVEQSRWPVLIARALPRAPAGLAGCGWLRSQPGGGRIPGRHCSPGGSRGTSSACRDARADGGAHGSAMAHRRHRCPASLSGTDAKRPNAICKPRAWFEALQSLKSAGLRARGQIAHGDAADVILRYTRTQKIDLTVVGARGLGAVRGWLLGRVSIRPAQRARGSVLVVRRIEKVAGSI